MVKFHTVLNNMWLIFCETFTAIIATVFYTQRLIKNLTKKLKKHVQLCTNFQIGSGSSKKAVWIDGAIHAREWIAPATALYIIERVGICKEESKIERKKECKKERKETERNKEKERMKE